MKPSLTRSCVLSLFAVLLRILPACPAAQAADSIPIKVPAGMVPVLKKQADGSWLLEVVSAAETASTSSKKAASEDAASAAAAEPTKSAGATEQALEAQMKDLDWDAPVPTSPAFTALGISPENVSTPMTPREFALSLLNGTDRQGRIQSGFAVDFAPLTWLEPGFSHEDYSGSRLFRSLYNTSISIGTTKESEDGDAQRVALGVSMRLWNSEEDDVVEALSGFAKNFVDQNPLPINDPRTSDDDAAHAAALSARHNLAESEMAKFARLRTQTWGRGSASIAWAPTWISESGKWDDLRYDGSIAWAAASFQLNGPNEAELNELARNGAQVDAKRRFWHLLTQAQFREGEHVEAEGEDAESYVQDSLLIAARLRYGTVDFNGSAEIGYLRVWNGPQGDGDAVRYGLTLERKVADNTWLVVSAGQETGVSGGLKDESFVVGGIRFGLGQKASPKSIANLAKAASGR
jgi:hypothetical protein